MMRVRSLRQATQIEHITQTFILRVLASPTVRLMSSLGRFYAVVRVVRYNR